MKQIIIILMVLIHPESGDIDRIKSCELSGGNLVVDFGFGWTSEFPAGEYECKVFEEVEVDYRKL